MIRSFRTLGLPLVLLLSASSCPALDDRDAPKIDPHRIINESKNFLQNREPEISAAEYALYEKVVAMLETDPGFAVTVLEGMMNEAEPASPAFEFILGNAYYAAGKTAKAEQHYASAVKRYPDFLRAWNNLAVLYYADGRFDQAARAFAKSVSLGDRSPTTYGLLGYSLERNGDMVGAEASYLQALASDVGHTEWTEGLLRIYIEGKQFTRAESLVKQLIKNQPSTPRFWNLYATILAATNRKMEAIAIAESARALGLSDAESLLALGDLYADQGLNREAIEVYRNASGLTRDLGHPRLLRLARMELAQQHLDSAQQALDACKADGSPETRLEVDLLTADLLVARRAWEAARTLLNQVVTQHPLNGRGLLSLGRVLIATGENERALFIFEQAYQLPDTVFAASLELANLELKNHRYDKSAQYAERALSIEKTPALEQFLARVKALIEKNG